MRFDYFCRYLRLYSHKCYYLVSIFQIGFFFFPLKINLNLPEPLQRSAPVPCGGVLPLVGGSSISPRSAFTSLLTPWTSPETCQEGMGMWRWKSFMSNLQKTNLPGFNGKKWVFRLCCHPAPFFGTRRQASEKIHSATLTHGKPALSTRGLVDY